MWNRDEAHPQELGTPSQTTGAGRSRITPTDIQEKQFRLSIRGYNEREVDEFLDVLTEEVARLNAENRRLRDELGSVPTRDVATGGAIEAAEDILRQARQDAARIIADAEARARAVAAAAQGVAQPPVVSGPITPVGMFLRREKEFLQSLAGLIQSHADALKEEVRRLRETETTHGEAPPPETGAPQASGAVQTEEGPAAAGEVPAEDQPAARLEERDLTEPQAMEVEAVEAAAAQAEPVSMDSGPVVTDAQGAPAVAEPVQEPAGQGLQEGERPGLGVHEEDADVVVLPDDEPPDHPIPVVAREWGDRPSVSDRHRWEPSPTQDDEDEEEERSLKELFWGEE